MDWAKNISSLMCTCSQLYGSLEPGASGPFELQGVTSPIAIPIFSINQTGKSSIVKRFDQSREIKFLNLFMPVLYFWMQKQFTITIYGSDVTYCSQQERCLGTAPCDISQIQVFWLAPCLSAVIHMNGSLSTFQTILNWFSNIFESIHNLIKILFKFRGPFSWEIR